MILRGNEEALAASPHQAVVAVTTMVSAGSTPSTCLCLILSSQFCTDVCCILYAPAAQICYGAAAVVNLDACVPLRLLFDKGTQQIRLLCDGWPVFFQQDDFVIARLAMEEGISQTYMDNDMILLSKDDPNVRPSPP